MVGTRRIAEGCRRVRAIAVPGLVMPPLGLLGCFLLLVPSADGRRLSGAAAGMLISTGTASFMDNLIVTPKDTPSATPVCNPSWSVVTSPNPSPTLQYLFGVAAISPTDIWAVGVYDPSTSVGWTLTLHWDGSQWT